MRLLAPASNSLDSLVFSYFCFAKLHRFRLYFINRSPPKSVSPHKRPMHSVPLWIAAALYFVTLSCWQSHHVTALDQAFHFASYRSLQDR
jgi:hypothetical protein